MDVTRAAQSLTAINMQTIRGIPDNNQCSAYSITFDAATQHEESFIKVPVRKCTSDKLPNIHILAIPRHKRHAGENMFDAIRRFQGAVIGDKWS